MSRSRVTIHYSKLARTLKGQEEENLKKKIIKKRKRVGGFPSSPLVKTPYFQCRGHRLNPWLGN